MRIILIVFAVLGGLATAGWTFDALAASTTPAGSLQVYASLGFAGAALTFTMLCGFGAALLGALERQGRCLEEIRDGLARLPNAAAGAGPGGNATRAPPKPIRVRLAYTRDDGKWLEQEVDMDGITAEMPAGPVIAIHGFDRKLGARRSFERGRVTAVRNFRTGDVIQDLDGALLRMMAEGTLTIVPAGERQEPRL